MAHLRERLLAVMACDGRRLALRIDVLLREAEREARGEQTDELRRMDQRPLRRPPVPLPCRGNQPEAAGLGLLKTALRRTNVRDTDIYEIKHISK